MIKSKSDLAYYLEQDRKALSLPQFNGLQKLKFYFFPDEIWKFEKLLRYTEYYHNNKDKSILHRGGYLWFKLRLHNQAVKLGFTIPLNVCESGLSIAHYGSIVISPNAHIGKNCHIHSCVNIGASAGKPEAPTIGDNVYIGPGAIIFGNIRIANNVTIGANATVNKSCEEECVVLAGSPACVVKHNFKSWIDFNDIKL